MNAQEFTAEQFVARLQVLATPEQAQAASHLAADEADIIIGVRMGQVFALAKEFMETPLSERLMRVGTNWGTIWLMSPGTS